MVSLVPPLSLIPLSVLMMIFNLRVSIMGLHVSLSYCAKRSWITKRCGIFSIYPSISILHTFLPWSVSRSVYDAHPWDLLSQLSGRFQPMGDTGGKSARGRRVRQGRFSYSSPQPLSGCALAVSAFPYRRPQAHLITTPTISGIRWSLAPLVRSDPREITALHCSQQGCYTIPWDSFHFWKWSLYKFP